MKILKDEATGNERLLFRYDEKFPKDIIFVNQEGKTKLYRLVKTKSDKLTMV
jgi:hypothetical protein